MPPIAEAWVASVISFQSVGTARGLARTASATDSDGDVGFLFC
jgi:hypothetical protein